MDLIEQFPQDVYANVLLYNGKIFDWKIGNNKKDNPMSWTIRTNIVFTDFDKFTAESKHYRVNSMEEKVNVFRVLAPDWYRQWEHTRDYYGNQAYDKEEK